MEPDARRKALLEYLLQYRHETMHNLATRFGVSLHTIQRDITHLSCEYPIAAIVVDRNWRGYLHLCCSTVCILSASSAVGSSRVAGTGWLFRITIRR